MRGAEIRYSAQPFYASTFKSCQVNHFLARKPGRPVIFPAAIGLVFRRSRFINSCFVSAVRARPAPRWPRYSVELPASFRSSACAAAPPGNFLLLPGAFLGRARRVSRTRIRRARSSSSRPDFRLPAWADGEWATMNLKDFFRFQPLVSVLPAGALRQLAAEIPRLHEHANQPPFDRLALFPTNSGCVFPRCAFGRGFAQRRAQHWLIERSCCEIRGPIRAQQPVGNLLQIGRSKMQGAQLAFAPA